MERRPYFLECSKIGLQNNLNGLFAPGNLGRFGKCLAMIGLRHLRVESFPLAVGKEPTQKALPCCIAAHQLRTSRRIGFGMEINRSCHNCPFETKPVDYQNAEICPNIFHVGLK